MEQMNIDEQLKVQIDFTDESLPEYAREFQPLVWKDGEKYCCLLGPDPETGVFAKGASADEAIVSWNEALKDRVKTQNENDEVAQYIKDTLRADKDKVW